MGKKQQILVDTDILIKVYRGHDAYKMLLEEAEGRIAVSAITYLELLYGLKTRRRIMDLHKQMKAYHLILVSEPISRKALALINKYGVSHTLKPADALIAATALVNRFTLFTDNQQDFIFIKELKLYKTERQ